MKNIMMVIMMMKMNTEQHDEEDYIGHDDAVWRSLASCQGGEHGYDDDHDEQHGDEDNDGEDYDDEAECWMALTCKLSRWWTTW